MPNFALVRDGVVDNIIVADDQAWVDQYIADHGLHDIGVDVTGKPCSPGDLQKDQGFVPPFSLTASKTSIAADGMDAATVTYTDNHDSPPASVDGNINGQPVTLALTNGTGRLDVTSMNSGDMIDVVFGSVSTRITVA